MPTPDYIMFLNNILSMDLHPSILILKRQLFENLKVKYIHDDNLRSKLQSLRLGLNELRNFNEYVSRIVFSNFRSTKLHLKVIFISSQSLKELTFYLHDQKFDNVKDI